MTHPQLQRRGIVIGFPKNGNCYRKRFRDSGISLESRRIVFTPGETLGGVGGAAG